MVATVNDSTSERLLKENSMYVKDCGLIAPDKLAKQLRLATVGQEHGWFMLDERCGWWKSRNFPTTAADAWWPLSQCDHKCA
jgi:hypothetical protein